MNLHRAGVARPGVFNYAIVWVGRPGEVVDILAVVSYRLGAVRVVAARHLVPARSENIVLRDRQLHVISPEVGEEFCGGVKLVAVPSAVPPRPDLREPLSDHEAVAFVTGTSQHFRELVVEGNLECYLGTRQHRQPQADLKDGAVVGIADSGGVERMEDMLLT